MRFPGETPWIGGSSTWAIRSTIRSWALLKFNSPAVSYSKFSLWSPESQKAERRIANFSHLLWKCAAQVSQHALQAGSPFPWSKTGWLKKRSSHVNWFENVWSGSFQITMWPVLWSDAGIPDVAFGSCWETQIQRVKDVRKMLKVTFWPIEWFCLWPTHSKNPMFFIFIVFVIAAPRCSQSVWVIRPYRARTRSPKQSLWPSSWHWCRQLFLRCLFSHVFILTPYLEIRIGCTQEAFLHVETISPMFGIWSSRRFMVSWCTATCHGSNLPQHQPWSLRMQLGGSSGRFEARQRQLPSAAGVTLLQLIHGSNSAVVRKWFTHWLATGDYRSFHAAILWFAISETALLNLITICRRSSHSVASMKVAVTGCHR